MERHTKAILARQVILNRSGEIHAFELLFREFNDLNEAKISSDLMATSRVLINTMNNFGVTQLLGDRKGFININEELIEMGLLESLDPECFVLEVLETTKISPATIIKLKELKELGYTLALDDFDLSDEMENQFESLFDIVDIIKIDLMECDWQLLAKKMHLFKKHNLITLAEKVETKAQFDRCFELGFDLYQGYFFAKPQIIEGKKIASNTMAAMQIVALLQQNCETSEIVEKFKKLPETTVSLLRYMNLASNGVGREITSIKHAITMIGRQKLSRWLMLIIYSEGGNSKDPKSDPLYILASHRAKNMENLLEKKYGLKNRALLDKAFLCGIFSLMDTLLGVDMQDLLDEFNVDSQIQNAIVKHQGPLGKYMQICEEQDLLDQSNFQSLIDQVQLGLEEVSDASLSAYEWVEKIT